MPVCHALVSIREAVAAEQAAASHSTCFPWKKEFYRPCLARVCSMERIGNWWEFTGLGMSLRSLYFNKKVKRCVMRHWKFKRPSAQKLFFSKKSNSWLLVPFQQTADFMYSPSVSVNESLRVQSSAWTSPGNLNATVMLLFAAYMNYIWSHAVSQLEEQ